MKRKIYRLLTFVMSMLRTVFPDVRGNTAFFIPCTEYISDDLEETILAKDKPATRFERFIRISRYKSDKKTDDARGPDR